MGIDLHTVAINPVGSPPALPDRLIAGLFRDVAFPASAAALTALGAITAGTGFKTLPALAPSGGALMAGVSPADPAVAIATSLKCVTASVATPGTGVAINDTFTLAGGTLQVAGPYGNGLTTVPVPTLVTVTHAQLISAAKNAGGSGYVANEVITLAGGTAGTAAQITVDTVDGGGAILTAHVSRAGDYTVESATFTQASTSGSGTGATFNTAVWGALTLSITNAGGYTIAPATANTPANGTGTGVGVTITAAFGLGTALLVHSGNYSSAPSFTVTPTDTFGSGASIATGTLGGNGAAIPRQIVSTQPLQHMIQMTLNNQIGYATTLIKSNVSFAVALTPPTTGSTLAAGTFDVLLIG